MVNGYRNLCLLAWTYGLGLGSFRYSIKMLALERIRAKHFTKAWGFIKTAEALPVLFGVPLVSFLNEASSQIATVSAASVNGNTDPGQTPHLLQHGRAGYFVCSAAAAIATVLLFFIGHPERRYNKPAMTTNPTSCNGSLISHCGRGGVGGGVVAGAPMPVGDCPDLLNRSCNSLAGRYGAAATPQHWYPNLYNNNNVNPQSNRCPNGIYPNTVYNGQTQQPQQQQQIHRGPQLPPAYNHSATECHHGVGGGSGGGGPPRLQKSLSFAFQTPPPTTSSASIMWNEPDHRHHHYVHPHQHGQPHHHQQQQQQALHAVPCFYSRCSSR